MTQTELTPTASLMGKWKPYPAYKDSGVEWLGEIPAHWEVMKIKRLCQVKRGASPRPIDDPIYFDDVGEFAWVRISDVTASDKYLQKTEQKLSLLGQSKSVCLISGELFLSIAGSVGKPIITQIKCCIHDGFVYFIGLHQDTEYLFYVFSGGEIYKGLGKLGTQLNLNTDTIGDIRIPVPPLLEQHAIATFLDRETAMINALIAKKERLIELLQEKRAALISHAVTKGLDTMVPMKDSGVEWLGEIPSHWEVKRLKNAAQNGFVNGLFKKKDQFGSGTKLVNVVNLYRDNFFIDFESLDRVETEQDEYEAFKVLPGDIFFVRSSLKLEGVGSSASITEIPEPTVFECHIVRMHPVSRFMVSKYLVNYLNSSLIRQRLVALAETTTMTTISQPKLASLEVIMPPIPEQHSIATYLDRETANIDALISRIGEGIGKLREYSTALISAAVTGKIDVREENAYTD
jgi:type I restriction enzyme S subunit